METTYTKDPGFWRAGAISATSVMLVILAFLSVNSLADISAGGGHVPRYSFPRIFTHIICLAYYRC